MSKVGLVISREYFTRVRKKSFLLTTILVPLVIMAFYAIIVFVIVKGGDDKVAVAVIDEGKLFADHPVNKTSEVKFEFIKNETEQAFVKKYKPLGYDAFLYIPQFSIDSPRNFVIHSQSSLSISSTAAIENEVNHAIENRRLIAQGIDPQKYAAIQSEVEIQNTIDTKDGSKKSMAGVAYAVSFACGLLIYMMMLLYGTQVMRGVMEEKTNRIAEVMVSSIKPFQLMMGKIIGIGAVGLTQFFIWLILLFSLQFIIPLIVPDMMDQVTKAAAQNNDVSMANDILQGISSLPLLKIAFSFIFYFLGGYLTYASLFAAIGSVVSDDQQDAQQLVFPVMMPIILGFVMMTSAINNPNSSMAVFGSLFPLTSPIVMMGRITYDIPVWQLLTSMALLVLCFLFFTWLTAKIYRIGILMYGKKPSWKEMLKWAFKS